MMDETLRATLAGWGNFYLITGGAAAALTGLMFVVQTLIASERHRTENGSDPEGGIGAFGTPTVVHFALAFVISALLCAPWPGFGSLHLTLALIGLAALVYSGIVLRRARRQTGYVPTAYDWMWHTVFPAVAYAALLVSGVALGHRGQAPFFVIAAATIVLICVGIHNAWDTVTYLTISAMQSEAPKDDRPS